MKEEQDRLEREFQEAEYAWTEARYRNSPQAAELQRKRDSAAKALLKFQQKNGGMN